MEAVSPYMEMATNYIITPYGVAALAGVILVSVLLLVFSTQKEISYDDYSKMAHQPQVSSKASSQPKKPKKDFRRRKPKKIKDNQDNQDTVEEDEGQYDIVTQEEIPAPELIPLTMTEPQDQPKKKAKKEKKKKQRKEVEVQEEEAVAEEVKPVEEEEVAEPEVEEPIPSADEPEPEQPESLIEEAMEPVSAPESPEPVVEIEHHALVKSESPAPTPLPEKKSRKPKKKGAVIESGSENLFQIVDQADLSENDIETLLAILKSKEGDDNWVTGKSTEETKDSLRKKVQRAECVISDLDHTIDMMKQDIIDNSDDKVKLTMEIRNMEKRHQHDRDTLNNQIVSISNVNNSRAEEISHFKKEVEDRDRINNNLQIQLSKQRANPTINPNIDLKNKVVELEEELQESRDQYNDLERNLQQVNSLEKKLLDKDNTIAQQKSNIQGLENQLSTVSATDAALVEAHAHTLSLKSELEKLQEYVAEYECAKSELEAQRTELASLRGEIVLLRTEQDTLRTERKTLRTERETMRSELAVHKDTELSTKLAAAARSEIEEEIVVKSSAPSDQLLAAEQQIDCLKTEIENLQTEVKASKEKISELEKAPSESSMSSTVDISAEIAEQLQVAETQLQTVKDEHEAAKSEKSKLEEERGELNKKVEELEVALKEAKEIPVEVATVQTNTEELESVKSELAAIEEERESLTVQISDFERRRLSAATVEDEKLQLAVRDRDRALSDAKRFQEVLSKTEGILSQLQSKFEADIQKWAKDLEEKRHDLELERGRAVELEQKLAHQSSYSRALDVATTDLGELKQKLTETEKQLDAEKQSTVEIGDKLESEKRWHSETLLKLSEVETQICQHSNNTEDVESLQKANELEQKWHAQTLTQLQQANTDVTLLQEKLSSKNSEIAQLASQNEALKQHLSEASSSDLQDQVSELKGQSEESQIAEASQNAEKKFTSI